MNRYQQRHYGHGYDFLCLLDEFDKDTQTQGN